MRCAVLAIIFVSNLTVLAAPVYNRVRILEGTLAKPADPSLEAAQAQAEQFADELADYWVKRHRSNSFAEFGTAVGAKPDPAPVRLNAQGQTINEEEKEPALDERLHAFKAKLKLEDAAMDGDEDALDILGEEGWNDGRRTDEHSPLNHSYGK